MLHKINKKHIGVICLILVLGFLLWYKYPVKVPEYKAGKTIVSVTMYNITSDDKPTITANTESEIETQKLINKIKNIRFYKKIIQPSGVRGYSKGYSCTDDVIQLMVYICTIGENGNDILPNFRLDIISWDGHISINDKDYGIGFPGNKQELRLYNELYEFYEYILKNSNWDKRVLR